MPAPPPVPPAATSRWGQLLTAVPMLAGTGATALMFAGRQGGAYSYVIGAIFGISSLGMLATSFAGGAGRQKRVDIDAARRDYTRQLGAVRERVRATVAAQRTGLGYRHPAPTELWSLVDSFRLWERRPYDADFGVVRLGSGTQSLATPLVPPPGSPSGELDPMGTASLRNFLATYAVVRELPVSLALSGFSRVYVPDPGEAGRAMVRAVLAQLTVFHAPTDVVIAACVGPARRDEWDYLKWLPHARHPGRRDALGGARLVAERLVDLEELLGPMVSRRPRGAAADPGGSAGPGAPAGLGMPTGLGIPAGLGMPVGIGVPGAVGVPGAIGVAGYLGAGHGAYAMPDGGHGAAGGATNGPLLVVVLDGGDPVGSQHLLTEGGLAGVCLIDLDTSPPRLPTRSSIVLTVGRDATLRTPAGEVGRADALPVPAAAALARQLAPLRLAAETTPGTAGVSADGDGVATAPTDVNLTELLGIGDPASLDPGRAWAPRAPRDRLRVPIGVGTTGTPVELDLKESALDGMGPHGLLIGATGSGKSELLRTLVIGLAATHDSESLNFVLIDFKGGATFASLDRLPHTAAVITNLADDLAMVDRMTAALNGELVRRQGLLRQVGNLASLRDYEAARTTGADLAPLPVLLIVCDEFSELLSAKPDFIDLFVAIGRLGRSLGVHLLLASQRLEEGRLRGLDTHLSYRIGLRTFSAMESRTVLGVPDAYELPRAPGHGYLKYGTEPLVRFRAAYVSGAYVSGPYEPAGGRDAPDPSGPDGWRVLPFTTAPLHLPPSTATEPEGGPPPAESPPTAAPSLLDLLADSLRGAGAPAHQVWLPPLSTSAGLDELLGPLASLPDRGVTTVDPTAWRGLRVPVAQVDKPFEQRRDPLWLRLDTAGGHVAVVGGPQSGKSTLVRTLISALALSHTPREVTAYCLDFGGGALAALRDLPHVGTVVGRLATEAVRRTVGEVAAVLAQRERRPAEAGTSTATSGTTGAADPYGELFLVVDGWSTVRTDYEDIEPLITDIAARGPSYGVHVVVTAARWTDLRPALRDLLGHRLELRLGDPTDSQVNRKTAGDVPEGSPGRGITTDGLHFLAGIPVVSGHGTDEVVAAIRSSWPGEPAPAVRELPAVVPYDQLTLSPAAGVRDLAVPVGLAETDLRPVVLDFAADPHLLVLGDSGCGKSAFLRALATSITRRFRPEQARIVMVDYRRSMLGEVGGDHLIGYATSAGPAAELLDSVASYLADRLPGSDVTPAQLRARSWWTGPECFVLVDDYDLVAGGATNPVAALLDHLPQARDVGLHLVVARRSGGAARAMFEPTLARLRELAVPGLIMSGDREEGALLGSVRPQPMPPGRATLVHRRDGNRVVQLAYLAPAADDPG